MSNHDDPSAEIPSPDNPELYRRWLRRQRLIFNGDISEEDDERNFLFADEDSFEDIPKENFKKSIRE